MNAIIFVSSKNSSNFLFSLYRLDILSSKYSKKVFFEFSYSVSNHKKKLPKTQ